MPRTDQSVDVAIIGAGPAGLTAAYLLTKDGYRVTVIEKDPVYVGGISRTVELNGFRFDIGGHRFFSKSQQVVDLWNEMLPDDFIQRPRMSRIYYEGKFYSYPLRAFEALANLGITTDEDGKLSIDDTELTAALDSNFDQVGSYLTGEDGLMGRLSGFVSGYVATDGVLNQRDSALRGTLQNIDKQRESLDKRVESLQTRLYAQYNAMDSLVGQLSRTSESLGSMLANLPGFVKKDS